MNAKEAQEKYEAAMNAAWERRLQAIKMGSSITDADKTYYTALEVAEHEYRQVVGPPPPSVTA